MNFLVKIKRLCDQNGISLAVVLIPDNVQVDRTLQTRVVNLKRINSKPEDFDFTLPNRLLAARLKQQNIECLDLLDVFTSAGSHTVVYKPNDSHWNVAGNQLAAETIAQELFDVTSRSGPRN